MSWEELFREGLHLYQTGKYPEALTRLNLVSVLFTSLTPSDLRVQAIEKNNKQRLVFDSRAAVLDKLGRTKEALKDAKKVIDLEPGLWQVCRLQILGGY